MLRLPHGFDRRRLAVRGGLGIGRMPTTALQRRDLRARGIRDLAQAPEASDRVQAIKRLQERL